MTENHPITPPPELLKQWLGTYFGATVTGEVSDVELALANQAARWGADQELDACCEWLQVWFWQHEDLPKKLRAIRRPKPPSLKEEALAELELLKGDANSHGLGFDAPAIRRALEALPE